MMEKQKRGWLVVNGFLQSKKFDELTELFCRAAEQRGVRLQVIQNKECLVDTGWRSPKERPDFVIFWDKDILLAQYLEAQGIPVYNSSTCIAVCDDKRKTHLALYRKNLPMPQTIFAPMTYPNIGFSDFDFLEQISKKLRFPMVVKEAYGSFGNQVYLAENKKELLTLLKRLTSTELLFQEYIADSKGRDIRLQIVGDQVIGSMYRYSESDFRANITAGGKMTAYEPDEREISLARKAAKAVGADFAGVDLLFGKQGPVVCEVNSNAHFKNLLTCTGVNAAEYMIEYVLKGGNLGCMRG